MADENTTGDLAPSKRPRDVSPEEEDHEGRVVGEESQISTFSIDDEISCGICLGVLESPYTVIPCLHTFDKDCLLGWNDTCPLCKTRATSGRHSFQLQAIVNHYESKRPPHKRARADEAAGAEQIGVDKAEIYPFGVAPPVAGNQQPDHNGEDEDNFDDFIEDDEDEGMEDEDLFDILVGGRIVFPCAACRPGHHSGYTCPVPIPEPTDPVKDSEAQEYLNGRRPIAEPRRGDKRVPFDEALHNLPETEHLFTDELKAEINRACEQHVVCIRCSNYLPRNWPGRAQSICKGCGNATCEAFDQVGCPWRIANRFLTPFNETGNDFNPELLWSQVSRTHAHFFRNQTERQRFLDRLAANNITPASATQELLREAGHDEGDYFCTNCISATLVNGFVANWERKKENGEVPPPAQAPNPPVCWYGRECRTQSHNAGHAVRFNHDCDPRPQGQDQPAPQAPVPIPALAPDQAPGAAQPAALP
ncbi:protein polyubiquitination, partial [Rhizoctonia solani]